MLKHPAGISIDSFPFSNWEFSGDKATGIGSDELELDGRELSRFSWMISRTVIVFALAGGDEP